MYHEGMPTKDRGPNHVCDQCGKAYFRKWQKRFTSKFCSRECMYEAHKGAGNPMFRHGYRSGQDSTKARLEARKRYGNRCAICQWDIHAEVHHIVPKSKGGGHEQENLILLCPNHHWMADHGHLLPLDLQRLAGVYG
jgi:5-methylcytosine-specific restriction endonuclease McrA